MLKYATCWRVWEWLKRQAHPCHWLKTVQALMVRSVATHEESSSWWPLGKWTNTSNKRESYYLFGKSEQIISHWRACHLCRSKGHGFLFVVDYFLAHRSISALRDELFHAGNLYCQWKGKRKGGDWMTNKGKQSFCLRQETVGNRQLALAELQTLSTDFFLDKAISNRLSQQQHQDFMEQMESGKRLLLYYVPPTVSPFWWQTISNMSSKLLYLEAFI